MALNSYGRLALDHWREHLPDQFAFIPDPRSYFEQLGLLVGQRVSIRYDALVVARAAHTVPRGQRRAALEQLLAQAEAEALGELVYLDRAPGSTTVHDREGEDEFAERIRAAHLDAAWLATTTRTLAEHPDELGQLSDQQILAVLDAAGPDLRDALAPALAVLRAAGRAV